MRKTFQDRIRKERSSQQRRTFTAFAACVLIPTRRGSKLRALIDALEGRPLAAQAAAFRLGARLDTLPTHWTPELLEQPARTMLRGETLMSGLVARSLIGAAGRRTGWAPAWRELLVELRNHPHPDVRQEALELTTAAEV